MAEVSDNSQINTSNKQNQRFSLPNVSVFQTDQIRQTYASVTCSKKNVTRTSQIYSKSSCNNKLDNSFLSSNRFHILTPNDDKDEEDVLNGCTKVVDNKGDSKLVNTMLICADSHGKDLSWH